MHIRFRTGSIIVMKKCCTDRLNDGNNAEREVQVGMLQTEFKQHPNNKEKKRMDITSKYTENEVRDAMSKVNESPRDTLQF